MHRQTHLWIISLFYLFTAAICSIFLMFTWAIGLIVDIWLLAYLCGVDKASSEYPTWGGTTCFDFWMLCVHLVYILYIWLHWCIFVSKLYICVLTLCICISGLYFHISHVYAVNTCKYLEFSGDSLQLVVWGSFVWFTCCTLLYLTTFKP